MIACGSSREVVLKSKGSRADVYLIDSKVRNVELLALQDSVLLCAADTLLEIPIASVKSLRLKIASHDWIAAVIGWQVIPTVLWFATVKGSDANKIGDIAIGVTALTCALLEFSGPRLTFDQPWLANDVETLRLYMRYPQGLTNEQIALLRKLLF
jgi:hypothetical protein